MHCGCSVIFVSGSTPHLTVSDRPFQIPLFSSRSHPLLDSPVSCMGGISAVFRRTRHAFDPLSVTQRHW